MDARELATKIAEFINDKIEGSEAHVSSGGGTGTGGHCTLHVALDEEEQLFRIVIQEENG